MPNVTFGWIWHSIYSRKETYENCCKLHWSWIRPSYWRDKGVSFHHYSGWEFIYLLFKLLNSRLSKPPHILSNTGYFTVHFTLIMSKSCCYFLWIYPIHTCNPNTEIVKYLSLYSTCISSDVSSHSFLAFAHKFRPLQLLVSFRVYILVALQCSFCCNDTTYGKRVNQGPKTNFIRFTQFVIIVKFWGFAVDVYSTSNVSQSCSLWLHLNESLTWCLWTFLGIFLILKNNEGLQCRTGNSGNIKNWPQT